MTRQTLIVGSYTDESGADGIVTFGIDGDEVTDAEQRIALVSPSYLIRHPERPLVLAVSEDEGSALSALRLDTSVWPARLQLVNTVATGGWDACHLAVKPSGDLVLVAHYTSGTLTSHRLSDDGTVSEPLSTLAFEGSGPNEERQDAAHAHQVVFDGDIVLVPDLGSDRIHRVSVDADGSLTELEPVVVPEGQGPRHLVLTDELLAVAGELTGDIWLAQRAGDSWTGLGLFRGTRQDQPTQPSALVNIGSHVIVANRLADTFAELEVRDTELVFVDERPTGGKHPRDLVVNGEDVWIANQVGGPIARFSPFAGSWKQTLTINASSPACLLFVPA